MSNRSDIKRLKRGAKKMAGADLRGAVLDGFNLDDVDLTGAQLDGASFRNVTARHALSTQALARKVDFSGAVLYRSTFHGSNMDDAIFNGAALISADFGPLADDGRVIVTRLRRAQFQTADLESTKFELADMSEADLTGVTRANNAEFRRTRLRLAIMRKGNFTGAAFRSADLTDIFAYKANFTSASLKRSKITRARFQQAILTDADLSKVHGDYADFSDAILERAELTKAQLSRVTMRDVKATEIVMNKTRFFETVIFDGGDFAGGSFVNTQFQGLSAIASSMAYTDLTGSHITGGDLTDTNLDDAIVSGLTYDSTTIWSIGKSNIEQVLLTANALPQNEVRETPSNETQRFFSLPSPSTITTSALADVSAMLLNIDVPMLQRVQRRLGSSGQDKFLTNLALLGLAYPEQVNATLEQLSVGALHYGMRARSLLREDLRSGNIQLPDGNTSSVINDARTAIAGTISQHQSARRSRIRITSIGTDDTPKRTAIPGTRARRARSQHAVPPQAGAVPDVALGNNDDRSRSRRRVIAPADQTDLADASAPGRKTQRTAVEPVVRNRDPPGTNR